MFVCPANALPFSCKPAAESAPRFYTMSLRRDCCNGLFGDRHFVLGSWTAMSPRSLTMMNLREAMPDTKKPRET